VRKKALSNINKKAQIFDIIHPHSTQQQDYKKWYESHAPEEDELLPLRKATSEPNLKGRNPFKHRIRYKPHGNPE
jgi:hypothetical protein